MTKSVLWQQGATFPAQLDRQLIQSTWPVPGRLGGGMAVTVSTGRGVNIASGTFVVALGSNNGSALCVSDAVEVQTFAAAPGSGSSRIDLLICQVHDPALDAGSTFAFTFDIVLGTASSSPVPPAVPARAGVLAQVTSVGGQANLAQSNIAMTSRANPNIAYGTAGISGNLVNGLSGTYLNLGTVGMTYNSGPQLVVITPGLYVMHTDVTLNGNMAVNNSGGFWEVTHTLNGANAWAAAGGRGSSGFTGGAYPSANAHDRFMCNAGDVLSMALTGSGMNTGQAINGGLFTATLLQPTNI